MRLRPGHNRRLAISVAFGVLATGLISVGAATPAAASASWSIVSSPNNGTSHNILYGVSCHSASSCQVVGYDVNASGVEQTLVESWNGIKWSIVPSPNNGTST